MGHDGLLRAVRVMNKGARGRSRRADYLSTFEARGDLYNDAALIAPRARHGERQILIDLLRVEPHHIVIDAPAGGGYLAEGIRDLVREPRQIVCVEPSRKFAAAIDGAFTSHISPLDDMPLRSGTVDRVGSLAGLHHLADKAWFVQEAYRVLRPGGLIVVGDVLERTPVAGFLNGPVDLYTTTGHRGAFLREAECGGLLAAAGFVVKSEEHRRCDWEFESVDQLVRYCRTLFGMVKATEHQVREAVAQFLPLETSAASIRLPWSLVYGVGVKEGLGRHGS
jgi:SAM-dependent methyltransferase